MRVISQNGKTDIPYEDFVFSIVGNGSGYSIIATRNIAEPPEVAINSVIATYFTKEKAYKAMEMLRKRYRKLEVMKVLASGTTEYMEKVLATDEMIKHYNAYCDMNVFQFPQDDEIEV